MNVLMVTPSYPPLIGGIETHVYQLAKHLQSRDLDVTILWIDDSGEEPDKAPGDPTVLRGGLDRNRTAPLTLQIYRHLERAIRRTDPNIVHAHSIWYAYAMLPSLLKPSRPKFVVTNHSSSFLRTSYSDSTLDDLKLYLAGRVPDACITPSEELRETTAGVTSAPVHWIPNGVDTDEFQPGEPAAQSTLSVTVPEEAAFVVLTTRRFEPKNGMPYLVKSVPQTSDDVYYVMIGGGSQYEELHEWIDDRGLSDRVSMPGSVPHEEIAEYYRLADVSVLPSLKEAISISGLESMASGTPVIGTRVGGIPELVDHEDNGLLVDLRSPGQIAEAIERLRGDPEELSRMRERAREKAVTSFSWNAVVDRTVEVYDAVQ